MINTSAVTGDVLGDVFGSRICYSLRLFVHEALEFGVGAREFLGASARHRRYLRRADADLGAGHGEPRERFSLRRRGVVEVLHHTRSPVVPPRRSSRRPGASRGGSRPCARTATCPSRVPAVRAARRARARVRVGSSWRRAWVRRRLVGTLRGCAAGVRGAARRGRAGSCGRPGRRSRMHHRVRERPRASSRGPKRLRARSLLFLFFTSSRASSSSSSSRGRRRRRGGPPRALRTSLCDARRGHRGRGPPP